MTSYNDAVKALIKIRTARPGTQVADLAAHLQVLQDYFDEVPSLKVGNSPTEPICPNHVDNMFGIGPEVPPVPLLPGMPGVLGKFMLPPPEPVGPSGPIAPPPPTVEA